MQYIIDGHNLIGRLPDISLDDPDDEAKLVQKLSGWVARTRCKCVVIFDSGLPAGKSRMSNRGVQVVFSNHRTTADTLLMERIRKEPNPKMTTIVSSDNEVLSMARRRKMNTLKSQEFADLLKIRAAPGKPGPDVAADLKLTEDEVEEWMQIFEGKL